MMLRKILPFLFSLFFFSFASANFSDLVYLDDSKLETALSSIYKANIQLNWVNITNKSLSMKIQGKYNVTCAIGFVGSFLSLDNCSGDAFLTHHFIVNYKHLKNQRGQTRIERNVDKKNWYTFKKPPQINEKKIDLNKIALIVSKNMRREFSILMLAESSVERKQTLKKIALGRVRILSIDSLRN